MVSPWFSDFPCFPMFVGGFSHGFFPWFFPWFSHVFPWFSHVFPWFSHVPMGFSHVFPMFSHFPMVFPCFPMVFPMFSPCFSHVPMGFPHVFPCFPCFPMFPWFSHGFSHVFPMFFPCSHGFSPCFPMFPMFSHVPMVFPWFSHGFSHVSLPRPGGVRALHWLHGERLLQPRGPGGHGAGLRPGAGVAQSAGAGALVMGGWGDGEMGNGGEGDGIWWIWIGYGLDMEVGDVFWFRSKVWRVEWWGGAFGEVGAKVPKALGRKYITCTGTMCPIHMNAHMDLPPCHITEDRYAIIAEVSRYPLEPCLQEWQSVVFLFCRSLVATFTLRWWSWLVAHCIGGLFILVFSVVVIWACSKYGTPKSRDLSSFFHKICFMVVRIFGQSHIILSTVQPNNTSGKTMKMEGYYYLCSGTKNPKRCLRWLSDSSKRVQLPGKDGSVCLAAEQIYFFKWNYNELQWHCDPLPQLEEYVADINKPTVCVCFLATQGRPWKKNNDIQTTQVISCGFNQPPMVKIRSW